MKWYFTVNERGSRGGGALHSRLAVLSALRNTSLKPHLLTTGFRNDYTEWMEAQGVVIIETEPTFAEVIRKAAQKGQYNIDYLGHWLRVEVCRIENDDEFVLYTDYDVIFLRDPDVDNLRPDYFCCAPEFKPNEWNYCNSGVMLMNVPVLRETAGDFASFISKKIANGGNLLDEAAYNQFYRGKWERLDPRLNWKPYWQHRPDAEILHFHGPKLGLVNAITERKVPFTDEHMRTMGSLVATFHLNYSESIRQILAAVKGADLPERSWIDALASTLTNRPPVPQESIDLRFLDYKMFPD